MKLKSSVPSSASNNADIQAVRLPPQGAYDFPEDGAMCVMKGWGCTQAGGWHDKTRAPRTPFRAVCADRICIEHIMVDVPYI